MGAEMLPAPIRGNDVVGGGSALFEHRLHWGGGGGGWLLGGPVPWALSLGLQWGGEKDFPACVQPGPGSGAKCECLPAAFLIACSMAAVIQRRAEASAATETTMKRKRSLKNSPFINQLNCR